MQLTVEEVTRLNAICSDNNILTDSDTSLQSRVLDIKEWVSTISPAIVALGLEAFADELTFVAWLHEELPRYQMRTPIDMLKYSAQEAVPKLIDILNRLIDY